ncbi:MAG: hypothetical protein SGJ09_13095 [Phycisphaerae bacterium]|nr:hypothetical protein [Phycisphaerae bacterium]
MTIHIKIVTVAAALVCGSSTFAADWNLTFTGLGPAKVIGVNYNNNRSWSAGAVNNFSNYWAGQMKWHNNDDGRSMDTFCTQIKEHISWNQTVAYQQVALEMVPDSPPAPGPMGLAKATVLRDLYARFFHQVHGSGDNVMNAAFQLVVWEITHENVTASTATGALGQLNLGLGALQANSGNSASVVNCANNMLAQLGGDSDNDFRSFVRGDSMFGLRHDTAQDQIMIVPIPLPIGLAMVGLAGVVALRRRLR